MCYQTYDPRLSMFMVLLLVFTLYKYVLFSVYMFITLFLYVRNNFWLDKDKDIYLYINILITAKTYTCTLYINFKVKNTLFYTLIVV